MPKRNAFTLIELLVVITIIVLLLSLLAPAMDKAIYQAELAVCGARLGATATGAAIYAMDNNRRYPNRPGNREAEDTTSFAPFFLQSRTDNNSLARRDVRPIIKDYIGPKLWPCPLAGDIDLSEAATEGVDRVYSGYNYFFGFTYTREGEWLGAKTPEKGMLKLGDRWSFTQDANDPQNTRQTFRVLASDIDWNSWTGESFGSHADDAGTMTQRVSDGDLAPWAGDGTLTWSWWQKGTTSDPYWRGVIDMNYAREDGSVSRLDELEAEKDKDSRATYVALFDTRFGYDGGWMNVPKD